VKGSRPSLKSSLNSILGEYRSLAVLFSGGRDSEVLLRAAVSSSDPGSVLSITADSPLLADFYRRRIRQVCGELGLVPAMLPVWRKMEPLLRKNGTERCYVCRKTVYGVLFPEALARGAGTVADGTTVDDLEERRPGLRAAEEEHIMHPFVLAGMGRSDVIELGRSMGMRDDGPPPDSCLATRIPEGMELTRELLRLVESVEAPLRPIVRGRFRVRVMPGILRVEYQTVDGEKVLSCLREMETTAGRAGMGIETVLTDGQSSSRYR